jgi:predicted butyrate kinase (DUF1464 family)
VLAAGAQCRRPSDAARARRDPGQRRGSGAAVLADGLVRGALGPLVERMRVREATGSELDHLRVPGAQRIRLA